MPKVKSGRIKSITKAKRLQKPATRINQVSPQGRVLPARIGLNPVLVVVEDTTLRMMMADPRFLEAIPCLRSGKQQLTKAAKTCGRCSGKRTRARQRALNTIRNCMAGLAGEQRKQLKKLLGAKQVRIILKGRHVTY